MAHGSRYPAQLYRAVSAQGVQGASPHRVVQMLMEGALSRLAAAKGEMEHGERAEKGRLLGSTISILEGLRASLYVEAGGEMAVRWHDLYEYMQARLLEANLRNDPALIDEVYALLMRLKSAWDGIASRPSAAPVDAARSSIVAAG